MGGKAFLVGVVLLLGFVAPAAPRAERPNILFIIADDASRDSFGAYGCTYIGTPGFDRVAREGVRFTQAYDCNPKCAPSRACLLTGRYSWQLEEACNHQPFLSDKWVFYPWILREKAGYSIGFTGKGWGPGVWKGQVAGGKGDNPAGPAWNRITRKPPYTGMANTDYAANFAAFLDARDAKAPFCFWLGTKEPHRRYEAGSWKKAGRDLSKVTVPAYFPDTEAVRGDLADYALEVEWYDLHITRALEHLEKRGLLDDTVVIATSDHGMPFPRVKGQIYDDGFHVPFAVRWGAKIKAGRTVTDFITFPDLAPTLLEIAGVAAPDQMTGRSFLPQLVSKESGRIDPSRDHTLLGKERHDIGRTDGERLSVGYPSRAIRNDRWLYVRNFKPDRWPVGDPEYGYLNCDGSPTKSYLTGLSQADPNHRFTELAFGKRPEQELYDVVADPDCVTNLAGTPAHAETAGRLWAQLRKELEAQGDPRILGKGDIFDFYPNRSIERQQKLYKRPDWDPRKEFEKRYGKK